MPKPQEEGQATVPAVVASTPVESKSGDKRSITPKKVENCSPRKVILKDEKEEQQPII